jgi:nucleoside 2-deoxyribosyltransferase
MKYGASDLDQESEGGLNLKIVVCGSYGDMKHFLEVLERLKREHGEQNVFPTREHLKRSEPCIEAHHRQKGETDETLAIRSELMRTYFDQIDRANLVEIVNEKNGKEHYGVGTTIELGYAFAKGKRIQFTRKPTNANILSLEMAAKNQFYDEICRKPEK